MPSAQDPSNPLRAAFKSLKDRIAPEKELKRKWKEETGELTAEDYPVLGLPGKKERNEPQDAAEGGSPSDRLGALVQGGQLRKLDGSQIGSTFSEMLTEGLLDTFVQAVDQVRSAMESSAPDDRRWALESVRALISQEDLSLIPYGTMPLLLDCVGRLLLKEERVELRDSALNSTASLLGIMAAQGDLESVHAHLAWLERTARGRGAEYTSLILDSRHLVTAPLALFYKEGHAVLEDRVLPFFRFVGEPGARTLMLMLDEDQNRQHRSRILEVLKLLGPLSIPALKEGLVSGSWRLVRNALNLVGDLEAVQAFEYVVPCLEDSDPRVVHSAIRALWKTGGARAERYLLDLLPHSKADTLPEILQGLNQVGTAAAVPVLGALAAEVDGELRIKILETFARIKRVEAIPFLEAQIKRKGRIFKKAEPLPIRLAAAQALVSIGTMEARHILEQVIAEEPKGPDQEALRKAEGSLNAWG